MTFLRSINSVYIFSLIISALLFSCSRSRVAELEAKHVQEKTSSAYEWSVQSYEAGAYSDAVKQFTALHKEGALVLGYEMIPFYLGMSHYHLKDDKKSQEYLENFLQIQSKNQESIEARITLLLLYEKAKNWDKAVALAAETNELQIFQDNRALLKLIWARALREKGELLGARAALRDAKQFMENIDETKPESKELWSRLRYVEVLSQEQECAGLKAKELPKKKILYSAWLETEGSCWKTGFERALEGLRFEGVWQEPTGESLERGIENWGLKIKKYLSSLKSLGPKQALQKIARQQLYQSLELVDKNMKNFKDRGLSTSYLERVRKKIDHLIVSL